MLSPALLRQPEQRVECRAAHGEREQRAFHRELELPAPPFDQNVSLRHAASEMAWETSRGESLKLVETAPGFAGLSPYALSGRTAKDVRGG